MLAWGATLAAHGHDFLGVGVLMLLSLPGTIVAMPLALAGLGNVHDPNLMVIDAVDFAVYAGVIYWLLGRRRKV
jgi:hypothetical protein